MLSINDYLDNILIDFESYARSGVKLCDLKSVHYDAGRIPDYSSLHIQQLYLLRYAYAILLSISACMKHCSTVRILAQA